MTPSHVAFLLFPGVTQLDLAGPALTAAIRGEDHAKFVQLSIEYDPHPPFDSGTPDKADAATLAQ